MKRLLFAFALLMLLGSLRPANTAVRADDDEKAREAFKLRPFNDHLAWDDAKVLVGRALKGDADARAEIEKGGLSYVTLILQSPAAGSVAWGYSLLDKHKDWFEDMQRWERVLLRNDAKAVLEKYKKLKPRFENAEHQLARAIVMAWRIGDADSTRSLIEISPESKFVKAARAYGCIDMDARTAAELMLPVSQDLRDAHARAIEVVPSYWDEELRGQRSNSNEVVVGWQRRLFELDGIEYLRTIPREWDAGGFVERLGALVAQVADPKFSELMAGRYATYCGRDYLTDPRYHVFLCAAGMADAKTARSPSITGTASRSMGPVLWAWASALDGRGMELERALCAISGLYGNPDLRAARDRCLDQCLAYPDTQTGLLAMRAVLALRDGRLDGVVSVARALVLNKHWALHRSSFCKALEATKEPRLIEVAKQMNGNSTEFAPVDFSVKLDLSLEQRAALLQPFVHEDENAAHGGVLGVYYLNRAVFLEAGGTIHAAAEYFAAAACEAARVNKRNSSNVNSIFWTDFVARRYGPDDEPRLFERLKAAYPGLPAIIEAETRLSENTAASQTERAFYIARDTVLAGKTAPQAVLSELQSNLSRGGGMGLSLVAWSGLAAADFSTWQKQMARADRTSPLDLDVAYHIGPGVERFGWYNGAQWEGPARSALRMVLVQPDHANSISRAGHVLAVQGSPSVVVSALFASTSRRSVPRFTPSQGFGRAHLFRGAYFEAVGWFKETMRAWGDQVPNANTKQCMDMLYFLNWQSGSTDTLWYISDAALRPAFMQRSLKGVMATYNNGDVNNLLNFSLAIARHDPATALQLIQRSEDLGVNDYGHFVGSQAYIRSKASQGDFVDALARYREMRGEDVGRPTFLDRYLLMGLTEGNQYAHVEKALEAMVDYEWDTRDAEFNFVLRRALMATGRYSDVTKAVLPKSDRRNFPFNHCSEYSAAFHEAPGLLAEGKFDLLAQRAEAFIQTRNLGCIGVCLDAAILRALALKEKGDAVIKPDDKGCFHMLDEGFSDYWIGVDALLDTAVLEVLQGKRAPDSLPEPDTRLFWHGSRYAERPSINNGTGFLSEAECEARDPFIRGVLAYLSNRKDKALEYLQACVAKDQRCSHEYHVAQWLLEKRLAPPPAEKK